MNRSSMKTKTFLLIISNLLTGTLMFCFSIMLSRKIGSEGMGLYQLVMPIYSLFLCISGGGITISISKLAAEEKAKKNTTELYKTISSVCIFELIWSIVISIVLLFISGYISSNILNEPNTRYLIMAFSPAIMFVSLSSVYKGAYYGLQKIIEPALIDVIEKIIRITFIIVIFNILPPENLTITTAVAVMSFSLGELSSLILFYTAFKYYKHKNPPVGRSDNGFQLIANTIKLALPLAINGILSTVFSTLTTLIIPTRLEQTGMSHEAAVMLLGKLQGMVLTIIFYPTVIITSMSVLLVPALSESIAMKKAITIKHHVNTAFTVASITAFSSAAILLTCPDRIGVLFYKDSSLGQYIKQITYSVPFLYLGITSFAILNGLGKQKNVLINSTILSMLELIQLYILLGITKINVTGYAIDIFIVALIGLLMNIYIIVKSLDIKLNFYNIIIFPLLCSMLTYFLLKCVLNSFDKLPIVILLGYIFYFTIYIIHQILMKPGENPRTYRKHSF